MQNPNLKCQAGKVDGRAEGEAGAEEGGEEDVAAVAGSAKTFVGTVPGARNAPQALRFANNVIPHHL